MQKIPFALIKFVVLIFSVAALATAGSEAWLPYPYDNLPYGLAIGIVNAIMFTGLFFMMWKPQRPSILFIIAFSLVYFYISGMYKLDPEEFHIFNIQSKIALMIGWTVGVAWLYWRESGVEIPPSEPLVSWLKSKIGTIKSQYQKIRQMDDQRKLCMVIFSISVLSAILVFGAAIYFVYTGNIPLATGLFTLAVICQIVAVFSRGGGFLFMMIKGSK